MAISNLGNISGQYISDPLSRGTLGLSSPLTSGYNPVANASAMSGISQSSRQFLGIKPWNTNVNALPTKLSKVSIPTSTGGGGFFGKMGSMFGANKLSSAQGAGISMAGSVINKLGNSLISDGMSTGAGNAVADIGGTVGGIVGNFNPVLGGIISAGTGIIGGVINRGFGYSIANEGAMKSNTARLGGMSVGDDFASMTSATSNAGLQGAGRVRNGWFNHKGDRIASDLMMDQIAAQAGLLSKVNNAGMNIDRTTDNLAQASYAALGGFLGNPFNPNNTGALGIMQQDAYVDAINNRSNAMYGRRNNGVYAFGGELGTNGADFTNGLLQINAGGLHETNPYQGVQMGVDAQGTPNLVEQGETVFNDYVFSNRMKVPETLHRHFGLGGRLKDGITFADASKKIAKESEERPNDPISIAGLNDTLARLAEVQEAERQREQAEEVINGYAFGGPKSSPTSKLGALRRMRENQDEIRGLRAEQKSYALTPNNTGESIPWDAGVRDRMRYFQDNIGRLKDESAVVTPIPGVFGGGDFGSGAGGHFDLYPDYSDRTTFNEAFDAAYEDALSQGLRPEDYIFMYGEKPYTAEKTKNPLREVDNRLVGNSNKRSKLKKTDNYQHMTMGIPGSGIQFAQGGLMGNLFDGTGEWPNNLPREGLYYQIYRLGNNILGDDTPVNTTTESTGNYYRDNMEKLRADSARVTPVPGVFGGGTFTGGGAGGTFTGGPRVGLDLTPMLLGNPAIRPRDNSILYPLLTNPEVQAQGVRNYLRNNLGTENDPFTNYANEQIQKMQNSTNQPVAVTDRSSSKKNNVRQDTLRTSTVTATPVQKTASQNAKRTAAAPEVSDTSRLGLLRRMKQNQEDIKDLKSNGNKGNTDIPSGVVNDLIRSRNKFLSPVPLRSTKDSQEFNSLYDNLQNLYYQTNNSPDNSAPSKASNAAAPKRGTKAAPEVTAPTDTTPVEDTTRPEARRKSTDPGVDLGKVYETLDGKLGAAMRGLSNTTLTSPWAKETSRDAVLRAGAKIESPVSPTEGFDMEQDELPTWMRYIPALGGAIGVATDALGLTNRPDYTYADKIEAAADSAGYTPDVQYTPLGNYMQYNPMDITYGLNQLAAQSRATDRGLQNVAGTRGAAMSGLLANGYNNQLAEGNMYRQALEYNDALRKQVEEFNKATDQYNSQMGLEAAVANARYQQIARNARLSGLAQAAAMRDAIDQRISAARSANLTNLFNSLGNIGKENFIFNQINASSPANNNYGISTTGTTTHRGNKMLGSSKSKKSNKKGGQ